jgi:hypothetical protein
MVIEIEASKPVPVTMALVPTGPCSGDIMIFGCTLNVVVAEAAPEVAVTVLSPFGRDGIVPVAEKPPTELVNADAKNKPPIVTLTEAKIGKNVPVTVALVPTGP